jgi:formylmethanofuran dehydrogenase subunit E
MVWVVVLAGVSVAAVIGWRAGAVAADSGAKGDWYYFAWLREAPYSPAFAVLDTESSLGPYAEHSKAITLEDLIKMHGHACDGLVTAACAVSIGVGRLYPDGVIDRTDTGCITNNSPCFGDVAAYLSGGRIRFGTQKIDPSLGNEVILYRFSTGEAVKVTLKAGVFPEEIKALEKRIKAGEAGIEDIRRCQELQWAYAKKLVNTPLEESFVVEPLPGFQWTPDTYEHLGKRGDIIEKNVLRKGQASGNQ